MSRVYPTTLYTGPDAQRTAATRWLDGDLFVAQDTGVLWVRAAGVWKSIFEDYASLPGLTVDTTAAGTQTTATALTVTDGTGIINGAWLIITTAAGATEYRQVASGGGTTALVLTVAHSGVTNGALISMLSAGIAEASIAGNTDGSTTLAERMEYAAVQAWHPMAFGAHGDGATDDLAAFRAIETAASGNTAWIVIDRNYMIDTSLAASDGFGRNLNFRFESAGKLTLDTGFSLLIYGQIEAPNRQIFAGAGTVAFGTWAGPRVIRPEWWGAVGDNTTAAATNSAAIAAAIASMMTANGYHILEFQPGRYKISGNPAIYFDRAMTVHGNNAIFDYGSETGTAIQVGGPTGTAVSQYTLKDFRVVRTYTADGSVAASATLEGTGVLFQNCKNVTTHNLYATGFQYGLKHYGLEQGASYIWHYNPILITNLVGMHFDSSDHTDSWCTEVKIYGGRIGCATTLASFNDMSGSRLVHIANANLQHATNGIVFYGTNMENATERKVEVSGEVNTCAFNDIYWDAGAFDTGQHPYTASLTNCTSNGTATITKTAHGLSIVAGDLVLVTDCTTDDDEGWYIVASFTADTIVVDRVLSGSDSNLALTLYRANIQLGASSASIAITNGVNLENQGISDAGTAKSNVLLSTTLGINMGSAQVSSAVSETSLVREAALTIRKSLGYTYGLNLDNTNMSSAGQFNLKFRKVDLGGTLRPYAGILGSIVSRAATSVTGKLALRGGTGSGASNQSLIYGLNVGELLESIQPSRGTLSIWTFQNDATSDGNTYSLPNATGGIIIASCGIEGGAWVVKADGTVAKIAGTTNTAAAATSGSLCVYQSASPTTTAILRNRIGSSLPMRAVYFYG